MRKPKPLSFSSINWNACLPIAALICVFWVYAATAQDKPPAVTAESVQAELNVGLDTLWVVFCSTLVFFMNAGFALVESGFCRRKNAVNILAKNLIVFAIATIIYWLVGFGFMFGDDGGNNLIGLNGFLLSGEDNSPAIGDAYKGVFSALNWTTIPLEAKFLFQLVFAGTAATIVSGAVAERIKFGAFLIYSFLLVGIGYAIPGHWIWGGGWLADMGFFDFAGCTAVHSVGGWGALVGAAILGPRLGRYTDGKVNAIPGHNMGMATLGCLILWLGWFGFNPGSTMDLNPKLISHIAMTTNMSGAFGGIAATITSWALSGKPDLSMIVNGILAGLVGVTAACAFVSLPVSAVIGVVAGILVVFAVAFFDNIKIDDPVGATSVHLACGVWGTLAVGLFSEGDKFGAAPAPKLGLLFGGGFEQLIPQVVGVLAVGGFSVAFSFIAWYIVQAMFGGIRVSHEDEEIGLDISEHGMESYTGF
ncbi:MAG: ammonium transporter [Pseudanabaenaceae cyanobacterium bins.68]|nr:ammonium transporter [Pseudanabaenaceae cyanobacterium bins.68]